MLMGRMIRIPATLVILFITTKILLKTTINIHKYIFYEIDNEKIYRQPNFTYIQNRKEHYSKLLSDFECSKEHIKVLILVTTHPSSSKRRKLIRQTWGKTLQSHNNNDFRTFFVVGQSPNKTTMDDLHLESHKYNDIVIGDFVEHLYNLSEKVQAGFEWSYKHCSFDHLLKVDDDVYVNLPLVFNRINNNKLKHKLYLGYGNYRAWVRRAGKYAVTLEDYSKPFYPDYVSGGAFVFSRDVVKDVLPYIKHSPFKIDDVYIGILTLNAGVKITHDPTFKFFQTDCKFTNQTVAHHPAKTRECMESLFFSMLANNFSDEFVRKHYLEGWFLN